MGKVHRRPIATGTVHEVLCAVLKDGTSSPASDVLDQMAEGTWENPKSEELPDDMQIDLHDQLFAICEDFAEYGTPASLNDINQLGYGMWEFKVGWLRAAFYDTDGEGNHDPKLTRFSLRNQDWDEIPEFCPELRITLCMSKYKQKAVEKELAYARQVRGEDLSHDKKAS